MSELIACRTAAAAYVDPATYFGEMAVLRASSWQLVAIVDDLAEDGAQVHARVLAVDVTITRAAGGLYAVARRESIRVEPLGRFVFVALAASVPPLLGYLGAYADVLSAASSRLGRLIYREATITRANWKHCVEISLDDYHVTTVHPTTFGAGGELALHQLVYRRDGRHSCYLKRRDRDWQFDAFWSDARAGRFDQTGYKIFNVFPNAIISTMREMCGVTVCAPLDRARTTISTAIFEWLDSPIDDAGIPALAEYVSTFLAEDRATCEGLQESAEAVAQRGRTPRFGALEQRITWFQDAYMDLMKDATP